MASCSPAATSASPVEAMAPPIRCRRVNHLNLVVPDYDAGVAALEQVFGGVFLKDLTQKEWRACLVDVGRVIFELFVPHDFLLNARYGPHYLGIEYQADMGEVRAAIAERGVRVVRDIGLALHTHPADTCGVALEFYDGEFHDNPRLTDGRMQSAAWWRETHPLGFTGLKRTAVAVRDLAQARALFQTLLGGEALYEADRPGVGGRAVGLLVADSVLELLEPTGDGALADQLERFGEGIWSTVFQVRDLDQARRVFAQRGVTLEPGAAPDALRVPPALTGGLSFELSA